MTSRTPLLLAGFNCFNCIKCGLCFVFVCEHVNSPENAPRALWAERAEAVKLQVWEVESQDCTSLICYFDSLQILLIITCLHDVSSRKPHPAEAIFTLHQELVSQKVVWVMLTAALSRQENGRREVTTWSACADLQAATQKFVTASFTAEFLTVFSQTCTRITSSYCINKHWVDTFTAAAVKLVYYLLPSTAISPRCTTYRTKPIKSRSCKTDESRSLAILRPRLPSRTSLRQFARLEITAESRGNFLLGMLNFYVIYNSCNSNAASKLKTVQTWSKHLLYFKHVHMHHCSKAFFFSFFFFF